LDTKLFRIRKDRLDIKLKKKELKDQKKKEKEDLIRPATFEEVKEFDPKVRAISFNEMRYGKTW